MRNILRRLMHGKGMPRKADVQHAAPAFEQLEARLLLSANPLLTSPDVPKPISDMQTVVSTLPVSGLTGPISDIDVNVDITHTWDGDLDVYLISPTGTRVELFTGVGSSGDNFTNTILDDEASAAIASVSAPFTGTFRPEGLLSALDGQDPNGTWRLEVTDHAGGDIGTLNSWALQITTAAIQAQSAPYGQVFAAGKPGGAEGWEYYSSSQGRIEVVGGRLRMDDTVTDATSSLNEAILHVNLTGKTNVQLVLDHWSLGDENTALASSFTGHYNGDGIALSVDGLHWVKVADLTGNFVGQSFSLDSLLVQAQTAAGSTDLSNVRIKFQQYDDSPAPDDGREFDNIRIDVAAATAPEITVLGNGVSITDGDTTPGATDGTDFGSVVQGGTTNTRTFTVRNDGTAALTLGAISVPTGFTLTEGLSTSLAAGASDTFTVRLDAATVGTKSGDISFTSNDSDETPFNFRITGIVAAATAPEITVLGNGLSITDGDTTPGATDGTDFGSVVQGGTTNTRTFTVRNDGTAALTLGAVSVPTGFTLTEGLSTSLAAGASDTFTVRLDAATVGTKSGDISFTSNDSNESPFNFRITGVVAGVPEIAVTGNGLEVTDGDTTPSATDGTDYASVLVGGSVIRTFTITNSGSGALHLTGTPLVEVVGDGAFTVVQQPGALVAAGASTTFQIAYAPTVVGQQSATVRIASDDGNENPYDFVIQGTGIQESWRASSDVPKPISDLQTVVSTLPVSGLAGPISDVDVKVNITHTWDGDLSVYLISPTGTRVELFTGVGNSADNFTNTILDDEAGTGIASVSAPFTGTFRPEGLLSVLDGQNPNGTWRLEITDNAGGDTGTLNSWSLQIATTGAQPQSAPYEQVFAAGKPGGAEGWEYYSSNQGRIDVVSGRLRMDDTVGDTTSSLNEAILHVNLTGKTNVQLVLDHWSLGDENTALASSFTGHYNGDGIALSVNGVNWVKVADLTGNFVGQSFSLDSLLVQAQTAAGSTDLSNVRIKFQQYDDSPAPDDGREFDNIRIDVAAATAPEITVLGNGVSITDGDTTPIATDGTDFGSVVQGGTTNTRTFTVRNDGTAALTLGAVSVPTGFTLTEGLSTSLAPGASDTFTVRLDATTVGTKSGDISFTSNDSDETPFNFRITGIVAAATAPEITVIGNGVSITDGDTTPGATDGTDFGSVVQGGATNTRTFTVRNDGTAALSLGAVSVPTGFTLTEGLSTSLAPGASDTFTVRLDAATVGTKSGDISFTSNDSNESPFNFRITGIVAAATAPEITVLGNGVSITDGDTTPGATDGTDFGSVVQGGATNTRTFTVRNDGTAALSLGAVTVPTGFTLTEGLSTSLAPGASDTFTVRLDAAIVGTKSGDISFTSNDSNETPFNFRITGIVAAATAPETTVLGNGVSITDGDTTPGATDGTDFGSVVQGGTTNTRTFTVRNDGTTALSLGAVTVPTGFTLTEGLSTSLAPGASDTFTVRLDAATVGTKSGDISFTSNDSNETPFNFRITGIVAAATAPEITVLGNGVSITDGDTTPGATDGTDFGSVVQGGTTNTRTFTVRNDGTAALTLGAVSVPTGFTLTEGLSTSLAPGASDTFTVRLDAATVGTKSGDISFTSNDSNESPFNFRITGVVAAATWLTSPDVPKPISDLQTVVSTLPVSGLAGPISDIDVKVDITHTWDGDLDVYLISPTGTRVELFTGVGNSGDNFSNTILDDEAGTGIASVSAPFTGTFRPEGLLSALDGQDPNGTWRLEVTDHAGGDTGTLNSWALQITTAAIQAQSAPYGQVFAAGKPGGAEGWEYYSSNQGRIDVVSGRLRMDDTVGDTTSSLNEAILHVNLTGKTNVQLVLDHWSLGDENTALASSFTGHYNGDGIALSVNGVNWVKLADLTGNFVGQSFSLDSLLVQAQTAAGSTDLSNVRIKFQQYDNYPSPDDGREFDNIQILTA